MRWPLPLSKWQLALTRGGGGLRAQWPWFEDGWGLTAFIWKQVIDSHGCQLTAQALGNPSWSHYGVNVQDCIPLAQEHSGQKKNVAVKFTQEKKKKKTRKQQQQKHTRSSHGGSSETNSSSVCEDSGSIPGPTQWLGRLRIWCCRKLGSTLQRWLGSRVAVTVV